LELLHFCGEEETLAFIRRYEAVRDIVRKRCQEYIEVAQTYQRIVEEANRTILLLRENATIPTPVTYDPNAHHC
jgi:hypothetical protein